MVSALPAVASSALAWTTRSLAIQSWQLRPTASIELDIDTLRCWGDEQADPIAAWQSRTLGLPAIHALAEAIRDRLDYGPGFCLVRGMAAAQPRWLQRLTYLAMGSALGDVLENYGRLYDVTDRGVCYRKQAVPVSMTRDATGFHTDSSARMVKPDYIALLCLQPGQSGGENRLCSAVTAHNYLAQTNPDVLELLYQPFIRDVVTPGADRDLSCIRANAFPVFEPTGQFTFRYMRYWIETGHRRAEMPLSCHQAAALDALDTALEQPHHIHRLRMVKGDQLWVNNRCLAHDRTAYIDDPSNPRTMVRLWVQRASSSH
ncbi:MAG: TauD/TfdA family dioxygenase [Leptolyngbyaceae cyanobacterium]